MRPGGGGPPCPLDGSVTIHTHRDRTANYYRCPWCKQTSSEARDLTREALNDWENR